MIRSMTGYGRAQQVVGQWDITVEIKSVNHRFFECSARVPRAYGYLEEKLKSALKNQVARGKVDVSVGMISLAEDSAQVEINHGLARSYLESIRALGQELGLADDVTLSHLTRFGDIFLVRKTEEEEDAVWEGVRAVFELALARFLEMREREGASLEADLRGRLEDIRERLGQVELLSPKTVEEYRGRLFQKLSELLEDRQVDEARVLTEAAIFAEKTAVAEETVRLRSHLEQFQGFLGQRGAVGRKLDFLVQEINREVNTIGSKAQDLAVARHVVEIKSDIEKIREQIQNIE